MPVSKAPYKRTYKHGSQRGNEGKITCDKCGGRVPRWKTFTAYKKFRINDPVIMKQMDKRFIHTLGGRMRVCPKCARFYHVVQRGKSVRKKHMRK